MLIAFIGKMRSGKTLASVILAKDYSLLHPSNKIYANFHLKLPNFIYTPVFVLPLDSLENCLLIIDDIYTLRCLDAYTSIIVNLSGKMNITVIFTCQYYTMIPPIIRTLLDKKGNCHYDKLSDILFTEYDNTQLLENNSIFEQLEPFELYQCEKAIKQYGKLYDTKEKPKFLTDSLLISELRKFCKTKSDLNTNLQLFIKSATKREKLKKMILKKET